MWLGSGCWVTMVTLVQHGGAHLQQSDLCGTGGRLFGADPAQRVYTAPNTAEQSAGSHQPAGGWEELGVLFGVNATLIIVNFWPDGRLRQQTGSPDW